MNLVGKVGIEPALLVLQTSALTTFATAPYLASIMGFAPNIKNVSVLTSICIYAAFSTCLVPDNGFNVWRGSQKISLLVYTTGIILVVPNGFEPLHSTF